MFGKREQIASYIPTNGARFVLEQKVSGNSYRSLYPTNENLHKDIYSACVVGGH